MEQEKIDRINELAKKAKTQGLTPEESAERDILRRAYIDAVKQSLKSQLDHTYYLDEQGNQIPLRRAKKQESKP